MLHVAILLKPYLDLILSGEKTIELRLTRSPLEPFEAIEPGHRIWLKQSAGPYRATALAEHVLCEGDLTPARIQQLKHDYNHGICGEDQYWQDRANARYATLVWLAEVEPATTGPDLEPSTGRAWRLIDGSSPFRKTRGLRNDAFTIPITGGNLRNNTLYVSSVIDHFPEEALGGRTRKTAGRPLTLILENGPTLRSDIVGPRKLLRTRVWGRWYRRQGLCEGDTVVFTPIDRWTFHVRGIGRAR